MRLTHLSIAAFALCALTATVEATGNGKAGSTSPVAGQASKPRTFMAWKKKAAPAPARRAVAAKRDAEASGPHAPASAGSRTTGSG